MIKKEISSWEQFCISDSDIIINRRMTKLRDEVVAIVFGKCESWSWMILDGTANLASGNSKSLQIGKFMVDLKLSDLTKSDGIENIFS